MTDEMFVKLMRDCGTDEETIAALLAQERQQRITNLEPPLAQTAPSSFPRPADGVDVFERIDRVWKWVQRLDQEKVSQELLGETVEMIGEEFGKIAAEKYARRYGRNLERNRRAARRNRVSACGASKKQGAQTRGCTP